MLFGCCSAHFSKKAINELTIVDNDTLFPKEYRHLISMWMLQYIYQRKWLINESNNAHQEFINAQTEMILALSDRVSVPQEVITPDLSYYS